MAVSVPGYQYIETIFSNGRTLVCRALREADGKRVILKQLEEELPDPGKLSRFSFSYDVLCQFDHPNIIKALQWLKGQNPPTIVLEDSNSIDLTRYLRTFSNNRLPVDTFLNIAVQLADALSVIHHAQVIHKDLHPGNILINPDTGQVQIIDFGLASLLSREQPALESPERLEGVLAYISPEQTGRMNRAVDYRTDFYTLGVTFYHLLCGDVPFHADDALGLVHAHIAKTQTPVSRIRGDVPAVLSQIVDKLLNKTAEERYQSALGLSKDLQRCRSAIMMNKPLPDFPLALDDIPDRFQVPQKLYGREQEVNLLLRRFFQAAGGKPKLLAVSGYSGIGKSALVHEVHKPIASYNGLFLSGKFDQFQRNIPYSALRQALKTWLQHTLSLSDKKLAEQRGLITSKLGANARVLIDFMSDFAHLLGDMPAVASLGVDETKYRFHNVFQQFIQLITYKRPLVIFIDDIQWADRGTLDLLPLLISEEGSRLLVVVAYRDNEVDALHPAIKTLDAIEASTITGKALSYIRLGPLTVEQMSGLLQDALYRPHDEVFPLAELIHQKTAGNPFFVGEFLKTLYTGGLLNFNLNQQRWCWSLEDIQAKDITDNVVELMLEKLQQQPEETQGLIQLAACVGSRFDLKLLAIVAGQPLLNVSRGIWPALRDGLLIQEGGDWFPGMVQQHSENENTSPLLPQCRFIHDRMLQAAYESMSEQLRKKTHLHIGRLLRQHLNDSQRDEDRFAITEQLNQGRSLIHDSKERERLIAMNLDSATRARNASVWQAAAEFSAVGIELLPDNPWQSCPETTQALYHLLAETEYLNGNLDRSDDYYKILFDNLSDGLVKAEICASRLIQSIGRGQWPNGSGFAREGLEYLGMAIPDTGETLTELIAVELAQLNSELEQTPINSLSGLPEMTDEKLLIAMRILPNLSQCSAIMGDTDLRDYCAIKGMNLILQNGKSDLAAIHLACYALYLRSNERYQEAFDIGIQAKKIADSYTFCREVSNCYNMLCTIVLYLKMPFEDCIYLNRKGEQLGLENGELARAGINACNSMFSMVSQGAELKKLQAYSAQVIEFLYKKSIFYPVAGFVNKFSSALLEGGTDTCQRLDDDHLGEELDKIKTSFHYSYLTHYRAQLAFWCDDYSLASTAANETRREWLKLPAASFTIDHLLINGLLLVKQWNQLSDSDQAYLFECESKLKEFTELYEVNFAHKYLLLKAEIARHQRLPMEQTISCYRDAIESAGRYGFIQYQALANELFAEYWLAHGFEVLSEPYVRDSLYLYQLWGCAPKVKRINSLYSKLLATSQKGVQKSYSRSDTISSGVDQALDLASVMKSAQHISSELRFDKLAAMVLQVIRECAGATSAALIFQEDNQPRLQALVNELGEVHIPDPMPLLVDCVEVPQNIISYVLRSDETVNLGDVLGELAFMDDPYIMQYQPRSVLCVPVDYRENTIGALYLENKLSVDTFTQDRFDVIKLLLSQAAISFENARLFAEVNSLNLTLERKVEQRTEDLARANHHLNQLNKDLEMANQELNAFSYSVSHDLRSPLRALKGFSKILKEEYADELTNEPKVLLDRIMKSAGKMSDLIDGLLELSRVQRREISLTRVDLSAMAAELFDDMRDKHEPRAVMAKFISGCIVHADARMMYSVMANLIGNAWKYASRNHKAEIEFGCEVCHDGSVPPGIGLVPERLPVGSRIFFVRDNGVGFDMNHAGKLFSPFQRLHSEKQFSGTGIGLATVKRVIERHGGYIWASSYKGKNTFFYFSLPE